MKNLTCNVRYTSEKAHFVSKLRSWYFVFIAYTEIISMSQEVALPHFSAISPWTFHRNVFSNEELRLSKEEKVIFQQYRTNKSFTTHYCLYFKARDSRNWLHLNSLAANCSPNLSLIQLIGSTNLHPRNTQTKKWQKNRALYWWSTRFNWRDSSVNEIS